ncbi:MAG: type IV pilus assembly protein FimV, partial [Gammaproteobacteria bacterium]
MMRIAPLLFTLTLWPLAVHALGLGKLELESGLNEAFDARIELISATRTELDSLTVKLADIEEFQRVGIDRPFVLSSLRFEVRESEEGPDFIRVFSHESIREPFLNFLVEANWSTGRLYREYTVLLDPPLYDSGVRAAVSPPMTSPVGRQDVMEAEMVESTAPVVSEPAISGAYGGGDYGPTVATDTLWSIASLTRPGSSISVQRMMLALLRANPEAFIENNVNGLRRGHILRMPSGEEIAALSQNEAMAQVRTQYAAWDEARGILAAATPERPLS